MTEIVVASSQQVPALQLLGRKAFGHLIIHDALHASSAEVEDVRHLKLRLRAQTAGRAPKLLDLLLQRWCRFFGYDTYRGRKEKKCIWVNGKNDSHVGNHDWEILKVTLYSIIIYHCYMVYRDADSFLLLPSPFVMLPTNLGGKKTTL